MRFNVVQLNPTKNLCYIDDWRKYHDNLAYGEALDDEVWKAMLDGYNYGEDWSELSWDEWDAPYRVEMPTLEFLSQFKVVVWSLHDTRSISIISKSAWFHMNYLSTVNVLAVYMTGMGPGGERGKVWAFGRGLVESSVLPYAGNLCEYPFFVDEDMSSGSPCSIRRGMFAVDYLHITGEFNRHDVTSGGTQICISDNWYERPRHMFVDTAGPSIPKDLYTRPPAAELYPSLPTTLPLHPRWTRGWPYYYFEVLEYPAPDQEHQDIFYDPVTEQMTGLIPLYRFHSRRLDSRFHNKYCGFRYIPSKASDPGEIVYFFFPMFILDDVEARATTEVVLSDWFGLPYPDVPGTGVDGAGPN
jgi:hypothetical protein